MIAHDAREATSIIPVVVYQRMKLFKTWWLMISEAPVKSDLPRVEPPDRATTPETRKKDEL